MRTHGDPPLVAVREDLADLRGALGPQRHLGLSPHRAQPVGVVAVEVVGEDAVRTEDGFEVVEVSLG